MADPDFSWVENPLSGDEPLRITVTKRQPEWIDAAPDVLRNPDSTPADIAAYRLARGVKRDPLPVADDRFKAFGPANPDRPSYIVEPDLMEAQGGMKFPEGLMQRDDGSFYYVDAPSQKVPMVRRPNILPIASTPEGYKFVTPKLLDIVGNVMGNVGGKVVAKPGEMVLGSGRVRTMPEKFNIPSLGKDVIGRDIPDWRGANVYHYTEPEIAEKIANEGYKTGSGYYGNMISFTNDPSYASQFGGVGTVAKISDKAKVLNLNEPKDWETFQKIMKGVSSEKTAEALRKAGYDGLYDAGAGDLFIANPKAVKYEKTLLSDTRPQVASAVGKAIERPNEYGFYSTLERAVANAKVEKAGAEQWLGYLRNQPGVKSEEIETVLRDMPKGMITKGQLEDIVKQNKVGLEEKVLGKTIKEIDQDEIERVARAIADDDGIDITVSNWDNLKKKALEELKQHYNIKDEPTKYHQYQLPGGENYREMLVKLPIVKNDKLKEAQALQKRINDGEFNSLSGKEQREIFAKRDALIGEAQAIAKDLNFNAPHFDEHGKNLLYHIRMNDRNIEGNKTLHLEEWQSDWLQQGRDYGFKGEKGKLEPAFNKIEQKIIDSGDESVMGNPNLKNALKTAVDKKIITQEEASQYERFTKIEAGEAAKKSVPDAPFKKNWEELALKRAVREAAEKGYDAISWTPGEAQALRYQNEIRQKLKTISWHNMSGGKPHPQGGKIIMIEPAQGSEILLDIDKNGIVVSGPKHFKDKRLDDVIGKDFAKQILEKNEGNVDTKGYVMGAEGFKQAYDKRAVDIMNNLSKKYGGKVETKHLPKENKNYTVNEFERKGKKSYDVNFIDKMGDERFLATFPTKAEAEAKALELNNAKGEPVHFLKLTPELKAKAMNEGFPLFSSVPTTVPVDYTPEFENKKKYKLKPVTYDPFQ